MLISDEFQQWLNQSNQILFCPGVPGAGKTITMSIAIDYLHRKFQGDNSVGVVYLYLNFWRYEQYPTFLLLSLLKQLAQSSLPENVITLYELHRARETRPTFEEVTVVLCSVISGYSKAFIIIDALDEYQPNADYAKFQSEIFKLHAEAGANLLVTSCFIPDIEAEFKARGAISLEIYASDDDVGKYVDGNISMLPPFVLRNSELKSDIRAGIIAAVRGMYVALAILTFYC